MLASRIHRYAVEALGTFTLVMFGAGSIMLAARTHAFGNFGIAVAFGLAVAIVVATMGRHSGAHINPAVTVALWSVRRFPLADVAPYVIAQCIGAAAASLVLGWLMGPVGHFGATVPSLATPNAFAVEAGYSGILALAIMVVIHPKLIPAAAAPVVLGLTVFVGAFITGPLTGGSFNPARSLGPALLSGVWTVHWLYWCAPIAGMVIAMRLYELSVSLLAPHPANAND